MHELELEYQVRLGMHLPILFMFSFFLFVHYYHLTNVLPNWLKFLIGSHSLVYINRVWSLIEFWPFG